MKILSNFVTFLENMNCKSNHVQWNTNLYKVGLDAMNFSNKKDRCSKIIFILASLRDMASGTM